MALIEASIVGLTLVGTVGHAFSLSLSLNGHLFVRYDVTYQYA